MCDGGSISVHTNMFLKDTAENQLSCSSFLGEIDTLDSVMQSISRLINYLIY